ncbi:MAG: hypothetical protein EA352_09245 [Gemmatimonadales bacterium]|nr:MAG: hypothetical protein EA352_09245 [Gemmatimonadales bacterium]
MRKTVALGLLALVSVSGCGGEEGSSPDDPEGAAADAAEAAEVQEQPRPELPNDAPGWLVELAHGDPLAEPQALSLFGDPLMAQVDESGRIAAADEALAGDPSDPDLLVAAGRERRHAWQYRQAIELYSRAIDEAPEDWRAWRFRGHRHLSLRDFPAAVADLEQARELAPMNWDVSYHLALAHFLEGDYDTAADEYLRCLALAEDEGARAADREDGARSCAANAADPESLVAMAEWTVRALMRAGRDDEAREVLAAVPDDLDIQTNVAYWHNLLLHKGLMDEEALLEPAEDAGYRLETVGFGVANRWLAQGDTARASELLERLMDDEWWPGFGRIAAEAELFRLTGNGS